MSVYAFFGAEGPLFTFVQESAHPDGAVNPCRFYTVEQNHSPVLQLTCVRELITAYGSKACILELSSAFTNMYCCWVKVKNLLFKMCRMSLASVITR